MRVVTRYIANDGCMFDNESDCIERDRLCDEIADIPVPGCGHELEDNEYVQHTEKSVNDAKVALCTIANRIMPHKWFEQTMANPVGCHASWAGRLIDELDMPTLRKLWYRIMCIDSEYREWQQPYFVKNPPKDPVRVKL